MAMPQDKVAEFMGDTESFSTCIIYRYVLVAVCDSDITRSLFKLISAKHQYRFHGHQIVQLQYLQDNNLHDQAPAIY
jgi:hypothetical protein